MMLIEYIAGDPPPEGLTFVVEGVKTAEEARLSPGIPQLGKPIVHAVIRGKRVPSTLLVARVRVIQKGPETFYVHVQP